MHNRLTRLLLLGAALAMLSGCDEQKKLGDFVTQAQFATPGGVYPLPTVPSSEVYAFASVNYQSKSEVRALLAQYFLRYDAALLERGLLDVETAGKDLISLLWEKEVPRNGALAETPSTLRMRKHIESDSTWFVLGSTEQTLLAANKMALQSLQKDWESQ